MHREPLLAYAAELPGGRLGMQMWPIPECPDADATSATLLTSGPATMSKFITGKSHTRYGRAGRNAAPHLGHRRGRPNRLNINVSAFAVRLKGITAGLAAISGVPVACRLLVDEYD